MTSCPSLRWTVLMLGLLLAASPSASATEQTYSVLSTDAFDPDTGVMDTDGVNLVADSSGTLYASWHGLLAANGYVSASSSLNGGESWTPPTILTPQGGGGYHDIACDDQGRAYVVWTENFTSLYVATTLDHGASFLPPVLVSDDQISTKSQVNVVCDGSGRVVVTWQESVPVAEGTTNHIFVATSLDFAASWPWPVTDLSPFLESDGQLPGAATDGRGSFYVAWDGLRFDGPPRSFIGFNASRDGGETWEAVTELRVTDAGLGFDSISADSSGRVYVIWLDPAAQGDWRVAVAVSHDQGTSFLAPRYLSGSDFVARDMALASDETGHVYVAWQADNAIGPFIHFNVSHDGGETWLPQEKRIDNSLANTIQPSIAAGPGGHVYVAWHDYRVADGLFLNTSTDFGETFGTEDIAIQEPGRPTSTFLPPAMATDARGHLYLAWSEAFNDPNTYFNRLSPALALGLRTPARPVILPAEGGSIDLLVTVENSTGSRISGLTAWIDATLPSGRTTAPRIGPIPFGLGPGIEKSKSLTLAIPASFPPGLYQVHLRSAGTICDQTTMTFTKEP